jgi:hypothetical protein
MSLLLGAGTTAAGSGLYFNFVWSGLTSLTNTATSSVSCTLSFSAGKGTWSVNNGIDNGSYTSPNFSNNGVLYGDYSELKFVQNSGTSVTGITLNSWLDMSVVRSLSVSRGTVGTNTANITITGRKKSNPGVETVITAIDMYAVYNTP